MVVIEVDGGQHADNQHDTERDKWLHQNGFMVLRFWNNDILKNTEGVVEVIKKICFPLPSPLPARGGLSASRGGELKKMDEKHLRKLLKNSELRKRN